MGVGDMVCFLLLLLLSPFLLEVLSLPPFLSPLGASLLPTE